LKISTLNKKRKASKEGRLGCRRLRNKTSKILREYLKKKIKYGENTYFY
jgi:hypothetical protein